VAAEPDGGTVGVTVLWSDLASSWPDLASAGVTAVALSLGGAYGYEKICDRARRRPTAAADVVAQLQSGVLGWVKKCAGGWCRFTGQGATGQTFDGYIAQERLWGVYPKEQVE
jgi:hypothetical protein